MKTILVPGWNVGFQKIQFQHALRRKLGYSLSGAKDACDAVLDGTPLELRVEVTEGEELISELAQLGAKVEAVSVNREAHKG